MDKAKENNNTAAPANGQQSEQGYSVFGTNFQVGDYYEILSPIGQGAYGVVVAARPRKELEENKEQQKENNESDQDGEEGSDEDGEPEMVAIKKIELKGHTAGMIRRTLREMKLLRLL